MNNLYQRRNTTEQLIHRRDGLSWGNKAYELGAYLFSRLLRTTSYGNLSTFSFNDQTLVYCDSAYNQSAVTERAVEIPIAQQFLNDYEGKRILEVGAVLQHYMNADWTVVDKFEQGSRIINEDILGFKPEGKFDFVLSVSTFEHIGFDDDEINLEKPLKTIRWIKKHVIKKKGQLVITIPTGYNLGIDAAIADGRIKFDEEFGMKRVSWRNDWIQTDVKTALSCTYGWPYNNANGLVIGIVNG